MNNILLSNKNSAEFNDIYGSDAVSNYSEKQYLNFEIKQTTEQGKFTAHAAVFNNVDLQGDIILPGAFAKSIKQRNKPIRLLSQHDCCKPIGVITKAIEDDKGLFIEGKLALEVQEAREMRALLKLGAIDSLSIGFRTIESEFNEESNIQILKEIELFEVSFVTFPANEEAILQNIKQESSQSSMDLDKIETLKDAEMYLRTEGLSKNKATAIVSIIKRQLLSESEVPIKINQNLSESDQTKSNQSESDTKQLQSIISMIDEGLLQSQLQIINNKLRI
jgi:HK97 family phage prohead protease